MVAIGSRTVEGSNGIVGVVEVVVLAASVVGGDVTVVAVDGAL